MNRSNTHVDPVEQPTASSQGDAAVPLSNSQAASDAAATSSPTSATVAKLGADDVIKLFKDEGIQYTLNKEIEKSVSSYYKTKLIPIGIVLSAIAAILFGFKIYEMNAQIEKLKKDQEKATEQLSAIGNLQKLAEIEREKAANLTTLATAQTKLASDEMNLSREKLGEQQNKMQGLVSSAKDAQVLAENASGESLRIQKRIEGNLASSIIAAKEANTHATNASEQLKKASTAASNASTAATNASTAATNADGLYQKLIGQQETIKTLDDLTRGLDKTTSQIKKVSEGLRITKAEVITLRTYQVAKCQMPDFDKGGFYNFKFQTKKIDQQSIIEVEISKSDDPHRYVRGLFFVKNNKSNDKVRKDAKAVLYFDEPPRDKFDSGRGDSLFYKFVEDFTGSKTQATIEKHPELPFIIEVEMVYKPALAPPFVVLTIKPS